MKILLFGSKGWIGKQFAEILTRDKVHFECALSRCDNEIDVENEIKKTTPTHIVCFIGRTHGSGFSTIDYLEQPGKLVENIKDNLYSPMVLAILSKKYNIHLTYLGTGCIFCQEDPKSTHYTEEDAPDFFGSSYSTVKGFTDRLMHMYDVLNLRIRMPITDYMHPRNFITKIVEYDRICSIPNSMTVLPIMLPIMLDMIKQNLTGTFNMVNPGIIEHNEILQMYKDIVDPTFSWKNFTIEQQNASLASKRSNNQLCNEKLLSKYPNVENIRDSIETCLIKIAECNKI